jgi:hypothetical protein
MLTLGYFLGEDQKVLLSHPCIKCVKELPKADYPDMNNRKNSPYWFFFAFAGF